MSSLVARIAFLASDVIVNSLPAPPASSLFAHKFQSLSKGRAHIPTIFSLPAGADPASTILRQTSSRLISFTSPSDLQLLSGLLSHTADISHIPIVLHIAVTNDLSDVLLLRSALPFFILSYTAQQAHDHAILASKLARSEKTAVVHVFYDGDTTESVDEVSEDKLQPFLLAERPKAFQANGHAHLDSTSTQESERLEAFESASLMTLDLVRRAIRPYTAHGDPGAHTCCFILGKSDIPSFEDVYCITVSLLNPFPASQILSLLPPSVDRFVVLEQVHRWSMKWTPLYLMVVFALQQYDPNLHKKRNAYCAILGDTSGMSVDDFAKFVWNVSSGPSSRLLQLGSPVITTTTYSHPPPHVPKHEMSYIKILQHLFGERLDICNSPSLVEAQGALATSPEFALGRIRGQLDQHGDLVRSVTELLESGAVDDGLHSLLSRWVQEKDDATISRKLATEIVNALESSTVSNPAAAQILLLKDHLPARSRWIIGSDAWSYDLGSSGLHHTIASGLDLNILLLDTLPYSSRNSADPDRRKRDVGLYAMNHGDVYVASVAVYASYSQVLQALVEAERYKGPSVVLAYLPYKNEQTPALEILKETKLAVDSGYWPLYRWDPSKEKNKGEPFTLDSDVVKNDLQVFLDRQNHLSQLVRSQPQFAAELVSGLGENVKQARRKKAQQAYESLLSAIDAPPLTVLYASDGGKAEKVAKRLAARGKVRGLSTAVSTLDSMPLDDLVKEEHVVFVTSVAGQGEPPQNGRMFFKAVNTAAARGERVFSKLKFSVFGMGDSHYWPRPEDAHYYNKPGKDLNARLEQLGGQRFAELGLGDDQDADGPETGYKLWEPLLWKALGVDSVQVQEAEPEPITNEHIKAASRYLRGTILEGLEDSSTGALAAADTQLTKFHGIYQQDDRDIRDERQAQGVEPAYSFMIRVRMPGGVCQPHQWLDMDQIADEHGSGTFKITTRQTFQFHGVIKKHLKPSIQAINRSLLDTLAACGDVNRNVVCSAIPTFSKLHAQVYDFSKRVSEHLLPRTTAYHEIWLDKKLVAGEALKDFEPLYGEFYLPRKFKIAVAVPPSNDVDVFTNDVGFIAIVDKGELTGFNVTAGGGMGVTHGNKKTYPRLGDVLGFCTVEQGPDVAEKIMLTQRDNGNRVDRKNARLKYTIDRMGLDAFKGEVEKRLGYALQPARRFVFDRNIDDFGWSTSENGKRHFLLFIENGRVQDEPGRDFKTGLREIAKIHKGAFRLTTNQHLMIADITAETLSAIKALLVKYGLDNLSHTGLRLSSSACVAFPTCGLAMAESERYLPLLIDKVEKMCEENGLRNDSIVMRMTGCPNGCARPYVAEVAFVGKSPGVYSMLLGGGYYGERLNKIYRESVSEPEILSILGPMIKRYARERHRGERFGDFVIRAGYISPTLSGKTWYEGMGG